MKHLVTIALASLLFVNVNAQNVNCDSLLILIETDKLTLAEKLGAYHIITEKYAGYDLENTYNYGVKGLELAERAKDKKMIATFYRYICSYYIYRTQYDTAHMYQQMQIDIAEDIQDQNLLQSSYFGMGNLHARQGEFAQAIENYQKAINYYNENFPKSADIRPVLKNLTKTHLIYNPLRIYILCLANSGECYRRLSNFDRALVYLTKAKEVMDINNFDHSSCFSQIHRELGYVYFAQGNIDKAYEHQMKVLNYWGGLNQVMESDCKEALIKILIIREEYDKALEYAHDCLRLAESLGDPYINVFTWNSFAEIYRAQGRYQDCESAAIKAWELDSTSIDTAPVSAINIAYANLFLGNPQKAEYFFKKNEEFNKQKSNKNFQEAMADLEVRYETEKKEIQIASLKKENSLYIWLGLAVTLLAAALGIVLRQKGKNIQREKQLIATRSIMDGERGERTRLARDLHDRLSGNLSAVKIGLNDNSESLQNICDKLDSCIEEIRRVAHNLMPVSLQYGLKPALEDFATQFPNLHFHFFGKEKRIEESREFIIYCCANELVNNALRHSGAKQINLQLIQHEDYVSLTVQDDGCGFDEKEVKKGIGLKNIRDRVASCNGKIDIVTLPNEGTEITIELRTEDI